MDTSIILARIIGPMFVLVGLGVLMNPGHYKSMMRRFLESSDLYYFSGTLAFVVGMLMIQFHNLWVADWRVAITLVGWMSLLKGVVRILFPAVGAEIASRMLEEDSSTLSIGAGVILLLGGWLSYLAFVF